MTATIRASLLLAGRSLLLVRRLPSVFVPAMVMPLFILVSTSGAFAGISQLPAFDGISYLRFTVPMAATMGAGFAGINAGMTLVRDIEGGFFARLHVTPIPRAALVAGPLLAAIVRSIVTTTLVLIAGAIGGILAPSVPAALLVYVLAAAFAVTAAGWSMGVALRTRSIQSAPLMQVVIFLAVFLSVAYTPLPAMTGWLREVADRNPVTFILEAARAAMLGQAAWSSTWEGLAAGGGLILAMWLFAATGLLRLVRE